MLLLKVVSVVSVAVGAYRLAGAGAAVFGGTSTVVEPRLLTDGDGSSVGIWIDGRLGPRCSHVS